MHRMLIALFCLAAAPAAAQESKVVATGLYVTRTQSSPPGGPTGADLCPNQADKPHCPSVPPFFEVTDGKGPPLGGPFQVVYRGKDRDYQLCPQSAPEKCRPGIWLVYRGR